MQLQTHHVFVAILAALPISCTIEFFSGMGVTVSQVAVQ